MKEDRAQNFEWVRRIVKKKRRRGRGHNIKGLTCIILISLCLSFFFNLHFQNVKEEIISSCTYVVHIFVLDKSTMIPQQICLIVSTCTKCLNGEIVPSHTCVVHISVIEI